MKCDAIDCDSRGCAAVAMSVGVGIRRATIRRSGGTHGEVNHYPIGKRFRPDIELTNKTRTRIEQHIMVVGEEFPAGSLENR